jgi:hypothetical protein
VRSAGAVVDTAIAELHKPGTFGILSRMATRKARHEQEADDFVSHSLIRVKRTASASNSGVNFLRFLRAMNNSSRIFALSGSSTNRGNRHVRATLAKNVM